MTQWTLPSMGESAWSCRNQKGVRNVLFKKNDIKPRTLPKEGVLPKKRKALDFIFKT